MSASRLLLAAPLAWLLATAPASAGIGAEDLDQTRFETRSGLSEYLAELGVDLLKDTGFTATLRIGDNRLDGAWELGLGLADKTPEDSGQVRWSRSDDSGWQDFTLSREGERITLTLGRAITALVDPSLRGIDTLALFAQADAKNDRLRLDDLVLNGEKLEKLEMDAQGTTDQALLRGLSGDFLLAGQMRMRWDERVDGTDPNRMMLQVSGYSLAGTDVLLPGAGPSAPIPEPASAALLGLGALALIGVRRKNPRDGSGGRI